MALETKLVSFEMSWTLLVLVQTWNLPLKNIEYILVKDVRVRENIELFIIYIKSQEWKQEYHFIKIEREVFVVI